MRPEVRVQMVGAMNISALILFYLRAVERFRAHTDSRARPPAAVMGDSHAEGALGEALNWADTIDQYLRKGPRETLGTNRDPNWAAAVDGANGELVRGFQHIRNAVHHQWWNAIAVEVSSHRWLWGTAPDTNRQRDAEKSDGLAASNNQMLEKEVLSTLDRLAEVFWERRGWHIRRSDVEQPGYPARSALPFDTEPVDQGTSG